MKRVYQLAAAILYVALFFLLLHRYQYLIDPDSISYINVARLFAKGEYYDSINACWSPLASWILVPFIKAGFDPVLSAKYINGMLGLLTLYSCYSLTDKFAINEKIKKMLPFPMAVFLLSCCFHELFADLLVLFLLMLYFNLVFSRNFIRYNYKILLAGALGAICYYAKAYSFPFFLVHFSVVTIWVLRKENTGNLAYTIIKKISIAFIAFFIIVMPYVILLSHKFGAPQISSAGKLDISWAIAGNSNNTPVVIEPPYQSSNSYWDDPTIYNQGKLVGPFTSFNYFIREIRWTFYNSFKYLDILNEISIFSIAIFIAFFVYLLYNKRNSNVNEWLLLITAVIYQIGYPPIIIDWRYVWLIPILLLLMVGILFTFLSKKEFISNTKGCILMSLVFVSFIHQPLNELHKLRDKNKDAFEIADAFKNNNIKGNFIFLNFQEDALYQRTLPLVYLTQSKLYGSYKLNYDFDEIMQNAQKYKIDYLVYYYDNTMQKDIFLQSQYAKAGIKLYDKLYAGIIVIQLK
jgi:hypothetical protein